MRQPLSPHQLPVKNIENWVFVVNGSPMIFPRLPTRKRCVSLRFLDQNRRGLLALTGACFLLAAGCSKPETSSQTAGLDASGGNKREAVPATNSPPPGQTNSTAQSLASTNSATQPEFPEGMSDSEKASAWAVRGERLMKSGEYNGAIEALRRSLKLDPSAEDVHYNLGITCAKAGRIDEAIAAYKEALKLLPDYAEAHNNLGNLLVKKGRVTEAIEHFQEAVKVNPQHAPSHNNLGTAYARMGRHREAADQFMRAVELAPDYLEARFNLGNSLMATGQPGEAVKQYKEVLRLNPSFSPAQQALQRVAQLQQQKR